MDPISSNTLAAAQQNAFALISTKTFTPFPFRELQALNPERVFEPYLL
jgi:hypothetical protein